MVILTCQISCTIRREDPRSNSQTYHMRLHQIMTRICNNTGACVEKRYPRRQIEIPPYEDKGVAEKYDLYTNHPTLTQSEKVLVRAFRREVQRAETNTHYYFNIMPQGTDDLGTFFHNVETLTFAVGFMSSPTDFLSQFHYEMDLKMLTNRNPKVMFEIDREKIAVDFAVSKDLRFTRVPLGNIAPTTEIYRLTVDFKHLSPMLLVHSATDSVDLCFLTTTPLQLWRTQLCITDQSRVSYEKTNWIRTCGVKSASADANQRAINKDTLGGCNVLMLRFRAGEDVEAIIHSLAYYGEFEVYHANINYRPKATPSTRVPHIVTNGNDDEINWMLAAIHSIGYRVRHQLDDPDIGRRFMEVVRQHATGRDERRHLYNALCKSYDVIANDCDKFLHIDRVLNHFLKGPKELDELVMTQTRMIKRLIITPSRILFQPPSLMHDNRILRAFDADSAVSCSFQNDDMQGFGAVANSVQFVDEAIGEVLRQGVMVAGRHYEFLGCSGSQLKSNGCWFYARDANGKTADDIRAWMGSLEHIRNPGTYLSRMGQCFSDTTAAELDADIQIDWECEDVEGGADADGKPYCFSDGVGRISDECMKMVFMKLTDKKIPSAFQVRLGGSKGMLTLDKNLQGKRIIVRKSMFKFRSDHATVEVMRRTQPTPLFLNNQVITLLSQLKRGIPDHVFIRFLNTMLHRLADVLLDDRNAVVALSQSGFPCCYSKLNSSGLRFTRDPFFKGILKAIICARINNVKLKTRIEIPHDYGRALLGVMDEEGVLEYGEIFVQYSADMNAPKERPIVLEGNVIVSKMPALHPGDIRKLKAVNKSELSHLVDCIVFPRKGPRPHPNEMAGSDLDGDEYFVTWHPDLIFPGNNEPPMDFPKITKTQQDHPITLNDMVEFIVNYIVNDKVGTISNAHLAMADIKSIHSTTCKDLARIFCHVIDFSKTGYLPDEVKGKNLSSLLPDQYPDFMAKEDHRDTYQSNKVLGKLYRISQRIEQAVTTIDKEDTERINAGENWAIDERILIPGHERYLEQAERLYEVYTGYLDAEQRRYGIECEEELVSGCVIKIKGMYSKADELFDIEKRLRERMKEIRKYTKEMFDTLLDEVADEDISDSRKEMLLASACYAVTYKNKRKHRSFPWIFAEAVLRILHRSRDPPPESPLELLSKSIDAVEMREVEMTFRRNRLELPDDEGLAKIYHVLINWGHKCKFLPGEYYTEFDTLRIEDYVVLLDRIIDEDQEVKKVIDEDTGPLLCAIFRAITRLDDDLRVDGRSLSRSAVINMKKHILLGHHQIGRDPTAQKLMIRMTGRMKRSIQVPRTRWDEIKSMTGKLNKAFKEKFNVRVEFRRLRHGGMMFVSGNENDVFDFSDFWYEKFQAQEYSPARPMLEELFGLFGI